MKRRDFLKFVGTSVVGAVVPIAPVLKKKKEKYCNFPDDNPAVYALDFLNYRCDFTLAWIDIPSWFEWAKYCQDNKLSLRDADWSVPMNTPMELLIEVARIGKGIIWMNGPREKITFEIIKFPKCDYSKMSCTLNFDGDSDYVEMENFNRNYIPSNTLGLSTRTGGRHQHIPGKL